MYLRDRDFRFVVDDSVLMSSCSVVGGLDIVAEGTISDGGDDDEPDE